MDNSQNDSERKSHQNRGKSLRDKDWPWFFQSKVQQRAQRILAAHILLSDSKGELDVTTASASGLVECRNLASTLCVVAGKTVAASDSTLSFESFCRHFDECHYIRSLIDPQHFLVCFVCLGNHALSYKASEEYFRVSRQVPGDTMDYFPLGNPAPHWVRNVYHSAFELCNEALPLLDFGHADVARERNLRLNGRAINEARRGALRLRDDLLAAARKQTFLDNIEDIKFELDVLSSQIAELIKWENQLPEVHNDFSQSEESVLFLVKYYYLAEALGQGDSMAFARIGEMSGTRGWRHSANERVYMGRAKRLLNIGDIAVSEAIETTFLNAFVELWPVWHWSPIEQLGDLAQVL